MGRISQLFGYLSKRWGEALCFTFGGAAVFDAMTTAYGDPDKSLKIATILLATGLILRGLRIWRERP